jgi:hypothetical protein
MSSDTYFTKKASPNHHMKKLAIIHFQLEILKFNMI